MQVFGDKITNCKNNEFEKMSNSSTNLWMKDYCYVIRMTKYNLCMYKVK